MLNIQSSRLFHEVFFNHVVGNDWSVKHIPFQKKHKTLPVVLNEQEIKSFLSVIHNPKYLAIAATLYSAGLRLSECLNLRIKDIDSVNMVITVRNGKGNKDRQTVLSEQLLQILRDIIANQLLNLISICSLIAGIKTGLSLTCISHKQNKKSSNPLYKIQTSV